MLRAHTLGLAPSQSVADESRVTIAMRTRWGSLPCAATRPKPRALPGGPGVKTLSSNAGGVGLIPGQGTKLPPAMGKLKLNSVIYWENRSASLITGDTMVYPDGCREKG